MAEPLIVDLVSEGGGMKGIAFIGALRALASYGYRPGRLLGTSVGSLFAFLIAAGNSADELMDQRRHRHKVSARFDASSRA